MDASNCKKTLLFFLRCSHMRVPFSPLLRPALSLTQSIQGRGRGGFRIWQARVGETEIGRWPCALQQAQPITSHHKQMSGGQPRLDLPGKGMQDCRLLQFH